MKNTYLMLQPYISNKNDFYEEKDFITPIQYKTYTFSGKEVLRYIPNGCEDLLFLFNIEETEIHIIHNVKNYEDIDATGYDAFGIRLRPGYAFAEDEILSETASMLKSMESFNDRRKYIRSIMKTLIVRKIIDKDIENVIEAVSISKGTGSVNEIYSRQKYSERHANRLFTSGMGIGVKDFARYTRFQNALYQMLKDPLSPTFSHMEQLNYSDQAHYQREFKQFMGMSPKKFIKTYLI